MTYTMPLRRTILHLAQRFRIDGETFMTILLANFHSLDSQVVDYTRSSFFRPGYTQFRNESRDSQDKRFSFGDSHRMLKMGCQ